MRITIDDIKGSLKHVTESYDIINAIRNTQGGSFQQYVPIAHADNVAEVGAGILANQTVQNDFITSLVDRIGLVVIKQASLENPLAKFKKGQMPMGRTIEEIFVDITNEHQFDVEDAEETLFKREIPNVKTLFHERNRQGLYQQTIQDDSLKTAFVSWGHFDEFLSGIINAIYNSAELDEYRYMKLLIDNYYSKGHFKVVPISKPDSEVTSREFVKKARATATKMTLPMGSRDFNSLAVHTRTPKEDLHLFIDADLEAEVDVDVLARAFNMGVSDFIGNVTVIDGFASSGLEAVLVDKDFYMVYDTLVKMETVRNAKGLYWNYFYHIWQILSVSRYANAVAFVSGDVAPVTEVIVTPNIASIKAGRTLQMKSFVRQTDKGDYPVAWSVEPSAGNEIASGTTINDEGTLTISPEQVGEVFVVGTATYTNDDAEEIKVAGSAIITVIPNI